MKRRADLGVAHGQLVGGHFDAARGGEELAALRQCERVWSVLSVLNYLRFLADKSGIAAELAAPGAPSPTR